MQTLRVALANWTDFDVSAHMLAQCLGIMPPHLQMRDLKWVYWSETLLERCCRARLSGCLTSVSSKSVRNPTFNIVGTPTSGTGNCELGPVAWLRSYSVCRARCCSTSYCHAPLQ